MLAMLIDSSPNKNARNHPGQLQFHRIAIEFYRTSIEVLSNSRIVKSATNFKQKSSKHRRTLIKNRPNINQNPNYIEQNSILDGVWGTNYPWKTNQTSTKKGHRAQRPYPTQPLNTHSAHTPSSPSQPQITSSMYSIARDSSTLPAPRSSRPGTSNAT